MTNYGTFLGSELWDKLQCQSRLLEVDWGTMSMGQV